MKREDNQKMRDQILETVTVCKEGAEDAEVSLNRIAREGGISEHTVSCCFPDEEENTAAVILKKVLNCLFVSHRNEEVLSYFVDDIHCYGLSDNRDITCIADAEKLTSDANYARLLTYELTLLEETAFSADLATVLFALAYNGVSIKYRLTGSTRMAGGRRKLFLLQVAVIDPPRKLSLFTDLKKKNVYDANRELLDSAISGGMMGGYIEKGFPFYYVNRKMLDYLGYEDEKDFVDDIGGSVSNCMHPDDRAFVDRETASQVASRGAYEIEYRMRRKNGTYLWMHDIGKKIVAEDGRDAIISVCYDITENKERSLLIENMIDTMNGGMVLGTLDDEWNLDIFYASAGVAALSNRSDDEYKELCQDSALDSVYLYDRESVKNAYKTAILTDTVTTLTYRVPNKDGGYLWINGMFSHYGEKDGKPVLRAVFTPVSVNQELQHQVLMQNAIGICVIDAETNELYYTNEANFRLYGKTPCDYTGKRCYEALADRSSLCDFCWRYRYDGKNRPTDDVVHVGEKYVAIHTEYQKWHDKDVFVEYMRDITLQKSEEVMLRQREEILETACEFAKLWVWTDSLARNRIHCYKKMRDDFGLPEDLDYSPEAGLTPDFISQDFSVNYNKSIEALRRGEPKVEFESKLTFPDGQAHWLRTSMNRLTETPDIVLGTSQLIDTERELEQQRDMDMLTKLNNRRAFERVVAQYIAESDQNAVLMLMDIDSFKSVNDTMGHAYGDMVLQLVGEYLQSAFRSGDTVSRLGGDEFVAFLPAVGDVGLIVHKAMQLIERIAGIKIDSAAPCKMGASIGLARYPINGRSFEELYKSADKALYRAKQNGKGRCFVYDTESTVSPQKQ